MDQRGGRGVVTGESYDQNAYRRELASQLGITIIMSNLDIELGKHSITAACDGISALRRVGMSY